MLKRRKRRIRRYHRQVQSRQLLRRQPLALSNNEDQYTWENGRLTGITWNNSHLTQNLDTSNLSALTYLYCRDNQLTDLDVSQNVNLSEFSCDDNVTIIKTNN